MTTYLQQEQPARIPTRATLSIPGACALLFPNRRCAIAAAILSLFDLSLPLLHGSSFLLNGGLDAGTRAILVLVIVLSWATVIWITHWYLQILRRVIQQTKWPPGRSVLRMSGSLLVTAAVLLYLTSWLFFWRLGTLPGIDALVFGALNAGMLTKYFWQAERTDFIVGLCSLMAITATVWIIAWRSFGRPAQVSRRWIGGLVVTWLTLNVTWLAMDFAQEAQQAAARRPDRIKAFQNSWPARSFEVRYRVNPLLSFLADAAPSFDHVLEGEIPQSALKPIPIRQSHPLSTSTTRKRSIVVITIESLRSDVILKQHQGKQIMPNLNKLAQTGHFFPNCYAQSVHSDYSDPCILSSLYPLRKPRTYFYKRDEPWPKVLIYDVLKKHGYSTAIFSSQNETWSNMHLFYESPNIDVFFDSRSYDGPTYVQKGYFTRWMTETGHVAGKLDDAITVRKAIEWIESEHEVGKPVFVSLNLQTSHFPYEIPNGKKGPFQPADFGGSFADHSAENATVARNAYFNALHYIDQQIGQLVIYLETSGRRQETILCITGDHGQAFYENGEAMHGDSPLETTTKVGANLYESDPEPAAILHETLREWRRRQLLYYAQPRYYNWFYPPREPTLSEADLGVLKHAAQEAEAINQDM